LSKEQKIVTGISIPRKLIATIDQRRGYIPRSRFISLILERHIHDTGNNNPDYNRRQNYQRNKSRNRRAHNSTNLAALYSSLPSSSSAAATSASDLH